LSGAKRSSRLAFTGNARVAAPTPSAQPFQDAATILIDGFRRDILFGGVMRSTALDQHEKTPGR
jgi:hypothetical protein